MKLGSLVLKADDRRRPEREVITSLLQGSSSFCKCFLSNQSITKTALFLANSLARSPLVVNRLEKNPIKHSLERHNPVL